MENPVLSVLSVSVIVMLVIVTGGVVYLTFMEWRDRRQVDQEKREARRR